MNVYIIRTISDRADTYQFWAHKENSNSFFHFFNTICYTLDEILEVAKQNNISYVGVYNDLWEVK